MKRSRARKNKFGAAGAGKKGKKVYLRKSYISGPGRKKGGKKGGLSWEKKITQKITGREAEAPDSEVGGRGYAGEARGRGVSRWNGGHRKVWSTH